MKKRRPSSQELAAFHEAGHAIVGHLLGWDIDVITIKATGNVHGYISRHRRQVVQGVVDFDIHKGEWFYDGPLPDRLALLYAGIVAERLLCMGRRVSLKPIRLGLDIREARGITRSLGKEKQIEMLKSAEEHAMNLLSDLQNWHVLERIAAKLLEVEALDGPSLRLLF